MLLANAALLLVLMSSSEWRRRSFSAAETALFSLQPRQIEHLRATLPAAGATPRCAPRQPAPAAEHDPARRHAGQPAPVRAGPVFPARLFLLAPRGDADGRVPFWPAALLLLRAGGGRVRPAAQAFCPAPSRARRARAARVLGTLRPVLSPAVRRRCRRPANGWPNGSRRSSVRMPLKLTEAEFGALVEVGAEEGALHAAESEMIQEIIKLGDKTAKDCMTPRVEALRHRGRLCPTPRPSRGCAPSAATGCPSTARRPTTSWAMLDARRFLERAGGRDRAPGGLPHYSERLDPPSYRARNPCARWT